MRLAAIISLFAAPAFAEQPFAGWRNGDLIFHESTSVQAAAIRVSTGSHYTHMGIVEIADGRVFVIEAARTVSATPLDAFISRGKDGLYAVYRAPDLTSAEASAATGASRAFLGRPYDIFFRLEPEAIYCSELPYYAFQSIGRELGTVQKLGDLAIDRPEAREIFLSRWEDHPDCSGLTEEACWGSLQSQQIVTPVSIAEDPSLELVFTNMAP